MHQENQTEGNAGSLTLHLPCCCPGHFTLEMPQPRVPVAQSSARSPLPWHPQASQVQGIQHVYFPL